MKMNWLPRSSRKIWHTIIRSTAISFLLLATLVAAKVSVARFLQSEAVKSLRFDGKGGYVSVDEYRLKTSRFSLEAWIRTSQGGFIVGWGNDGNDLKVRDGKAELILYKRNQPYRVISTSLVNDSLWHQLVGVYDDDRASIYVDGKEEGTLELPPGDLYLILASIGKNFKGDLSELRVYDRALFQAEIVQHYNYGQEVLGQPELGLIAGWHLDEGRGTTVQDYSGNNRIGVLNNGVTWIDRNPPRSPQQFQVTITGTPSGDGSSAKPWDLPTALGQPANVMPGDTIWVHGGHYIGNFTSYLNGNSHAPVILRALPGERSIIDDSTSTPNLGNLRIYGTYAWYWGLEFQNSHDDNRVSLYAGPGPADRTRFDGISVDGLHNKITNCIIHDEGGQAITPAPGTEINGCLLYNNGWEGPDFGYGHGLYMHNADSNTPMIIKDVISANNFGVSMKAYASDFGNVEGFIFDGVISFNNGANGNAFYSARRSALARRTNLQVSSGGPPVKDVLITNTYLYQPQKAVMDPSLTIGYTGENSSGLVIEGNYIAGGDSAISFRQFSSAVVTNNTFISFGIIAAVSPPRGTVLSDIEWDRNTYYAGARLSKNCDDEQHPFNFADTGSACGTTFTALRWDEWKSRTGWDASSILIPSPQDGIKVFIRPNDYDPGRANVAVYNWNLQAAVDIDVSTVLKPGTEFELRNASDYFGKPVLAGTYGGGFLRVPMKSPETCSVAPAYGYKDHKDNAFIPDSTCPEFAAFILLTR
jgi:hypothetical protein